MANRHSRWQAQSDCEGGIGAKPQALGRSPERSESIPPLPPAFALRASARQASGKTSRSSSGLRYSKRRRARSLLRPRYPIKKPSPAYAEEGCTLTKSVVPARSAQEEQNVEQAAEGGHEGGDISQGGGIERL